MNSTAIRQRSTTRFLTLLCLALLATLLPASGTSAQPVASDHVESVTTAAIEMSRQRENRELYELYDRLHSSARNVFPRMALLAWAESGEMGVPVDDPVIEHVTFGEWTFAHDGQRWRWFPDLPANDIARFTAEVQAEPATYQPTFRRAAYVRIDRFWEKIFTETGLEYTPMADIVAVTYEPFDTGCGVEEEIATYAIYYCTLDDSVYYDPGFQEDVVYVTGPYGFTTIIAHEWGHHIQSLLGIDISRDPARDGGLYPIEIELQADCLAGVYAQDALALGDIDQDEIDSAIEITSFSGDAPGADFEDRDAHGTASQRVQSFFAGFEYGFAGCDIDLDDYAA